jgi:hypothetical protein
MNRSPMNRSSGNGSSGSDLSRRAPVAGTCLELLDRSRASLLEACRTRDAGERYVEAHLGALRAAAALLAARSMPDGSTSSTTGRAIRANSTRSRPRSVWELLPRVAPELTEWSAFFAASARRRAAVERGGQIGARESDDLLRQAEIFLEIIRDLLGIPRTQPLAPISRYVAPVSLVPMGGGSSSSDTPASVSRAVGSVGDGAQPIASSVVSVRSGHGT